MRPAAVVGFSSALSAGIEEKSGNGGSGKEVASSPAPVSALPATDR
ncbi:hypothetical protein ACK6D9_02950 [Hoeflea sp. Naph1]